jgi:ABC-type polar amino acid transport system ATPase subunit
MPDAMIAVTGLAKAHGGTRILNGIDLVVNRGEVAVLIGSSGSGKSTLLRCINGLEPFQAGAIRVDNHLLQPDTSPRSSAESLLALRRTVGMVFQQFNLFPHLNAMDNVTLAPRLALRWDRDKAEHEARRLLDRVGLASKLTSKPEQLSGGEQQRVAIARALAVQPQAILFDEPTSALDPRMSGEVLAVIADLARDGLTMLIVTHAMSFARQVAQNVHVMHAGKIIESGTPSQVFAAPAHDATKTLLQEVK